MYQWLLLMNLVIPPRQRLCGDQCSLSVVLRARYCNINHWNSSLLLSRPVGWTVNIWWWSGHGFRITCPLPSALRSGGF